MADRPRIVFVCTGNICRSPIAEKVFRAELDAAGLADDVDVSSAGTGPWHAGEAADPRAAAVLRNGGYSPDHVARQVDSADQDADLLVALDSGHSRSLRGLGIDPDRIRLLRSFDPDADDPDVADPYYDGPAEFEIVLSQVEAAMPGLLAWVREQSR